MSERDHDAAAMWPEIEAHLDDALREAQGILRRPDGLDVLIRQRYLAGCKEHDGDWLTRPLHWFDAEAREEVADLLTYLAMRRVRAERLYLGTLSRDTAPRHLSTEAP